MSLDTLRDEAVLFGGMVNDGTGQLFRDTWVFNGKSWRLASESGPSPRQSHAIAFDTQRGVAVLFGGSDFHGSQSPQDTWEWNGASWSVRATAGPGPRSGAAMVYDAARRQTLLYGGATAGSYRDDTWAWDGVQWRALAASGPGPRVGAAMVYDAARERVVLFGGLAGISSSPPPPGDTWEWDGTAWSQVATSGPTGRVYPGLAFVAGANRTVLFGGGNGAGLSDAWTWDGSSWTPLTGSAPPGRTAFAMGASPTGGRALVFGGWVPTVSNSAFDTWELRVPFCRADADCSGDVAVADVFGYLGTWFAGSPPADFDGSGRVDLSDLFTFLGAWFDGCS